MCLSKFLIWNAVLSQLLAFFHLFLHICNCRHLLSLFHLTYNSICPTTPAWSSCSPLFSFISYAWLSSICLYFTAASFCSSELSESCLLNLLFNVVSTNTTISFGGVLPMVSLVSLLVGVGGHLLLWLVLLRNPRSRSKPSSIMLLNLSLADLGALLTLPVSITGSLAVGPVSSWDSQLQSQWEWRSSAWQHCLCWGIVSLHHGWDHLLVWQKCECEAEVGL